MNNNNTPKPHKHAELIKAWADGAKIQYRVNDETDCWEDCNPNPGWCEFHEYRVKPEEHSNEPWKPKKGEKYYYLMISYSGFEFYSTTCGKYNGDNIGIDEMGNCFRTREEAEAAAERVKAALKGELKISAPNDEKIQLDGKPLTDGEKELIKALRLADIRSVIPFENIAIYTNEHGELCNDEATIAFTVWNSNELIRAALEQIQAEQEEIDE